MNLPASLQRLTSNRSSVRSHAGVLFAIVIVAWGVNWPVSKALLAHVSPWWSAALRSVTVAQLKELKVTKLGSFAQEWQRLTGASSVPYIGIGAVRSEFVAQQPQVVARVIAGLRNTLAWGDSHREEVVGILRKSANLPEEDARIYAAQWNDMNRVAFEPADLATLKRQHEVFAAGGLIKGSLPADLFVTGPYNAAKKLK